MKNRVYDVGDLVRLRTSKGEEPNKQSMYVWDSNSYDVYHVYCDWLVDDVLFRVKLPREALELVLETDTNDS